MVTLYPYQLEVLNRLHNGCILVGGVGSGKSITSLAYYYISQKGKIRNNICYSQMKEPKDLYIITTAKKRDTLEWEKDMSGFLLSTNEELNGYSNKVIVDSWNNIKKYKEVTNAFFIFDEQRVVGYGTWTKSFLKIAKNNKWILLTATPGDTWSDYIPVFVANGFYKNKTDFARQHIMYKRYSTYPIIERYVDTKILEYYKEKILIEMDYRTEAVLHDIDILCYFDKNKYTELVKNRYDFDNDEPIDSVSELCYQMRKIVNSDKSRLIALDEIIKSHPKTIIFYNFDYELEAIKDFFKDRIYISEWNGHKHEKIPVKNSWIYLVQYAAGAEGWNCIETDTIIFYSQTYSYKTLVQAKGRIDRLNSPFKDLYYYHLKSKSSIDISIARALASKKKFNETKSFSSLIARKTHYI
ncbi:MAG: hypothetical protein J6Y02_16275 [Pseudobutyrivibrio sp.]|nr:hypothetical protein [Pseudobutyrivibrio sp.]